MTPSDHGRTTALQSDPRTRGGRETEARIRAVASQLFFEQGYHATTMRQVAAQSNVRVGSVYNYYASKDDLLFRIAADTMREMLSAALDAIDPASAAELRLQAFIACHIEYCLSRQYQARVADDFLHALPDDARERVVELRDEYENLLRDILVAGEAEHGWNLLDTRLTAVAIVTMITDVRLWYRPGGRLSLEDVISFYSQFVLNALTGSPAIEGTSSQD